MGGKKGATDPKAEAERKKYLAEKKAQKEADKTFGLKNKNKSKVVQQYVKKVQEGTTAISAKDRRLQAERDAEASAAGKAGKQAAKLAKERELAELFDEVLKQPKVPEGVDPKTILCVFHKAGKCAKGWKCKYSHDLKVERKVAKAAIYEQAPEEHDEEEEGEEVEGMDEWDQAKLEAAIKQKHGAEENSNNPTAIICRHFLSAVENKLYGWFWVCPGGKGCKYKHALPQGYIMKSEMQALLALERKEEKSLEEVTEEQRSTIRAATPINEANYAAWKKAWDARRAAAKREAKETLRANNIISGRDLFETGGMEHEDDEFAHGDYSREAAGEEAAAEARMHAQAAANLEAAAARDPAEELCDADFEGMDELDAADLDALEANLEQAAAAKEAEEAAAAEEAEAAEAAAAAAGGQAKAAGGQAAAEEPVVAAAKPKKEKKEKVLTEAQKKILELKQAAKAAKQAEKERLAAMVENASKGRGEGVL